MNAKEFIKAVKELSHESPNKEVRKNQDLRRYAKSLIQNMGAHFGNGSYATFGEFTDKSECEDVPQKYIKGLEKLKKQAEDLCKYPA